MAGWLAPSGAVGIVKFLFWGSVITSLICFLTDQDLHYLLRTYWKLILLCVALVLFWRIPANGQFFHGMEYEDSYVYTVAGRQMAEHVLIEPTPDALPYSITVCAVGSQTSCKKSGNFPEHLIGYPYVLSLFSNVFGYRPSIGSLVNVACASFADVLIFLLCMLIARDVAAAGSAALIFAITPVFAVWGLETSAEPFSNGCITLVLWFCLRLVTTRSTRSSRWHDLVTWCAFTTTLLFSLTVKRENILLAICLPLIAFLLLFAYRRTNRPPIRNVQWLLLSAALELVFSFHMKITRTMGGETALLNQFPLKFAGLFRLLTAFLHSFFIVQWYGGAVILVIAGAIVAWHRKALELFPLFLFAAYLLLYAFHVRSYYEMRSGNTDPRTALRFSMSLMSLWSILAGIGTAFLIGRLRRSPVWRNHLIAAKWIAVGTVASVIGLSYYATAYLRDDAVEDEFRIRIEPSLTAVRAAACDHSGEAYILTLEPLIPQMYATPSVHVVSLPEFDGAILKEIGLSEGGADFLYLDEQIHRTPADAGRYKSQMAYLNHFHHLTLTRNAVFSIIRIEIVPFEGAHRRILCAETNPPMTSKRFKDALRTLSIISLEHPMLTVHDDGRLPCNVNLMAEIYREGPKKGTVVLLGTC